MSDYNDNNPESSVNNGMSDTPQGSQAKQAPAMVEKFVIRLPQGLRNKIKHLSEKNRRSMNSEIIMVLEKHIQQNQGKQAAAFESELLGEQHQSPVQSPVQQDSSALSSDELTRRLENLPEEKKLALLELLG